MYQPARFEMAAFSEKEIDDATLADESVDHFPLDETQTAAGAASDITSLRSHPPQHPEPVYDPEQGILAKQQRSSSLKSFPRSETLSSESSTIVGTSLEQDAKKKSSVPDLALTSTGQNQVISGPSNVVVGSGLVRMFASRYTDLRNTILHLRNHTALTCFFHPRKVRPDELKRSETRIEEACDELLLFLRYVSTYRIHHLVKPREGRGHMTKRSRLTNSCN